MVNILKRLFPQSLLFATACLFVSFATVKSSGASTQKQCQETRLNPVVKFLVENADTTLNKSRTSAQIARFANSKNAFKPPRGHKLLGLAFVELHYKFQIGTIVSTIGGRHCVALKSLSIAFGRAKSEIFVARKYHPGTCEFKAILRHEQEHMDINARIQSKYEAKIQKYLTNKVPSIQPYYTTSPQNAPRQLASRFSSEINRIIKQFYEERQRINRKIDTPKSYKKVRSQCAKW